ncbi:MAG: TonB-dependent receptor [Bacteroidetes bacterium]|nr:TonB-dependent receptor [Bacteroidota bacterium]
MKKKLLSLTYLFLLLAFIYPGISVGQNYLQTIRGQVLAESNEHPISEATVTIREEGVERSVTTDEKGQFRLESVKAGRYTLTVVKDGFAEYTEPDLVVNAGKEVVLDIQLSEKTYEMESVDISSPTIRDLDRVSTRVFTVEETKRYAAVYFDPARMAASFPGVVQGNDQANHLVVRGNSPNGILWRLEGVDIVNPNHTANAGTFSDRLTQNGGGVIILSTQLLTNSSFSTGAFSSQFGNALSGVFDIHLRKGNDENYEFTGQAGLIGVDLAVEGPISKKKGSSFLANYRYSTVGLLSLMGIPLGDEEITYQDLSFNLSFPTEKLGTFTLFGMGGMSSNFFKGARIDTQVVEQKQRFDIDFYSNMGATGLTHTLLIGENSLLKSVVALSAIDSDREGTYLHDYDTGTLVEQDRQRQIKLSATTSFSHKISARSKVKAGIFLNQLDYLVLSQTRPASAVGIQEPFRKIADNQGAYMLIQPYVEWNQALGTKVELTAGLHSMYFMLNGRKALEPRLSLNWNPDSRQSLRFAYGLHSQLQLPGTYFSAFSDANGENVLPNTNLGFTKAHHFVLNYNRQLASNLYLRLEPYYQYLFNVPIVDKTTSNFSVLNLLEGYVNDTLANKGTGENYGIDISLEKYLTNDYYFLINTSLYQSKYTGGDGIKRDTRFNGNYLFNVTAGREFDRITKSGKNKVLGINVRMVYQGGFRAMPIDTDASAAAFATVFDPVNGFSQRIPDYFRTDFRITFKRNKNGFTRTLGIDIQNLTNAQNVAFYYYDFHSGKVETKKQLGMIPLLSYRLEF